MFCKISNFKLQKEIIYIVLILAFIGINPMKAFSATTGVWGTCQYTLDDDGIFTLEKGEIPYVPNSTGQSYTAPDGQVHTGEPLPEKDKITKIIFKREVKVPGKFLNNMFEGCINLEEIEINSDFMTIPYKDTIMSSMFEGCEKLKKIDISFFDTSEVIDIKAMFKGCTNLEEVELFANTKKVQNMIGVFEGCTSLKEIDVSSWDTSNVEAGNMYSLFKDCESVSTISLSRNFNTQKITNFSYMFSNCFKLNTINEVNRLDLSSATNVESMFASCTELIEIPYAILENANNITNYNYLFQNTWATIIDLTKYDFSRMTSCSGMFDKSRSDFIVPGNINTTILNELTNSIQAIWVAEDNSTTSGDGRLFLTSSEFKKVLPASSSIKFYSTNNIESTTISSNPTKAGSGYTYKNGENLDPSGLVFTLTWENNKKTIECPYNNASKKSFTFTPDYTSEQFKSANDPGAYSITPITIFYGGTTSGFMGEIKVRVETLNPNVAPENLIIVSYPKTNYEEYEEFDPNGLEVQVEYDDLSTRNEKWKVTNYADFSFSSDNSYLLASDKVVTVTYDGLDADIPINVRSSASANGSTGTSGGSSGGGGKVGGAGSFSGPGVGGGTGAGGSTTLFLKREIIYDLKLSTTSNIVVTKRREATKSDADKQNVWYKDPSTNKWHYVFENGKEATSSVVVMYENKENDEDYTGNDISRYNKKAYIFNENAEMVVGTINTTDGRTYYAHVGGREDGVLATNWLSSNGYWYYFTQENNNYGQMTKGNTFVPIKKTPDGYYVNRDGQWCTVDGTVIPDSKISTLRADTTSETNENKNTSTDYSEKTSNGNYVDEPE
ncbi:MAG: BspA family leucine-rich repeat surface protein [Eubacteriales bacterium]|nr:BspA family leucine-rich repeat surface protein [Eubacteriales bacterium]